MIKVRCVFIAAARVKRANGHNRHKHSEKTREERALQLDLLFYVLFSTNTRNHLLPALEQANGLVHQPANSNCHFFARIGWLVVRRTHNRTQQWRAHRQKGGSIKPTLFPLLLARHQIVANNNNNNTGRWVAIWRLTSQPDVTEYAHRKTIMKREN